MPARIVLIIRGEPFKKWENIRNKKSSSSVDGDRCVGAGVEARADKHSGLYTKMQKLAARAKVSEVASLSLDQPAIRQAVFVALMRAWIIQVREKKRERERRVVLPLRVNDRPFPGCSAVRLPTRCVSCDTLPPLRPCPCNGSPVVAAALFLSINLVRRTKRIWRFDLMGLLVLESAPRSRVDSSGFFAADYYFCFSFFCSSFIFKMHTW